MACPWQASIVIVGCVLVHLTLGTLYTFGNLSPYLTSYIRKHSTPSDLNYATSVWINSLAAMFQGVSMYFGGMLEHRIGPRLTVLMGAWFQSLGVALTYFAIQHSFALTMVTYGVMFGLGIGIAYAVPMAVAMRWLPDRKGMVNGFVVAGFGGGAFIFDQIQTAFINPHNETPDLVENDGDKYFTQDDVLDRVPKVFLLMGGCYAAMQFLGCLPLRNPPGYQSPRKKEEEEEAEAREEERAPLLRERDAPHTPVNGNEEDQNEDRNAFYDISVSLPAVAENTEHPVYQAKMEDEMKDLTSSGPSTGSLRDEINEALRRAENNEFIQREAMDDIIHREDQQEAGRNDATVPDRAMTSREMLREKDFYKLWFVFLANGQGVNFVGALYKAYGQTFISNDTFLAWVGTFSAVCNACGRIMWGSLADRYSFKVAMMCLCALFTVLMLTLGVTSLAGKWMFIVWVGLLFLSFSGSFSLMPTATARSFGAEHVSSNYGLLFTSQVVTSLLSAVLTEELKNLIGWYGMFFMVAGFSFFSFLLISTFNRKAADGTDV